MNSISLPAHLHFEEEPDGKVTVFKKTDFGFVREFYVDEQENVKIARKQNLEKAGQFESMKDFQEYVSRHLL